MSAFLLCLLLTWQDLQDLTYDRMVRRIPFQYITESLCLFKTWVPRVLEVVVIPT